MGQRTQMIIQRVNNKGMKRTDIWHLQWGYGRQMYLRLMALLIQDYFKDTFQEGYDFLDNSKEVAKMTHAEDMSDEFGDEEKRILNELDFADARKVGEVFSSMCDNNNGGVFIRITENETDYRESKIEFAFMQGRESGGRYDKFITLEKYGKVEGENYADKEFIAMFKSFVTYFDMKDMAKDKGAENK